MQALQLLSKTILLTGLALASLQDIKTGKISLIIALILAPAGFTLQLVSKSSKVYDLLLGCCIGAGLWLISLLSRGALGSGDALMFAAAGAFLGLKNNLLLLLISLGISAAASAVLLIFFRYRLKSRIPFIPFVLGGYICLLMLI